MNNKKFLVKIASIALLSTSIITSIPINSNGYSYNTQERIYRKGNQIIRVYGSANINTKEQLDNTSKQNVEISKDTGINNTDKDRITNSPISSPSKTVTYNNNEKIYRTGNQIIRTYSIGQGEDNTQNKKYSNEENTNDLQNQDLKSVYIDNLTEGSIKSLVEKMYTLINNERIDRNLAPLKLDEQLTKVAQLKAEDMVNNNYLSHNSRTYGDIYTMIRNNDIEYVNAGENISKSSSIEAAHSNFMDSYLHKRAILAHHFTHIGIGIDKHSNGMYKISVMFIEKNN